MVDVDLTIEKPFDGRYNDLGDPTTVNLTDTICAGVSKHEANDNNVAQDTSDLCFCTQYATPRPCFPSLSFFYVCLPPFSFIFPFSKTR